MKVPASFGVPLMVIVFVAQFAVTPPGNPVAVPIPVAPVVLCVIGVNAVLIHSVGVDDADPTVISAVTVTETFALTIEKPSLTLTVYCVFSVGLTVGLAEVELNPAGSEVQLYV